MDQRMGQSQRGIIGFRSLAGGSHGAGVVWFVVGPNKNGMKDHRQREYVAKQIQ